MIFMVLTYISPIDDVEHLFIGLLAICISPLETSLFRFLYFPITYLQAYINAAGIPIGGCLHGSCLAFEAKFPIINLVA